MNVYTLTRILFCYEFGICCIPHIQIPHTIRDYSDDDGYIWVDSLFLLHAKYISNPIIRHRHTYICLFLYGVYAQMGIFLEYTKLYYAEKYKN